MVAVVLLAVGVPSLLGAAQLGLRRWSEAGYADKRGIALQTVIIMVVLLIIAGAVAGVLITRGNEAVSELEDQQIGLTPASFSAQVLCESANFSWNAAANGGVGACVAP